MAKSGILQPPIRAFLDNLRVTTKTSPGCRWILKRLEQLIVWASMSVSSEKSRSFVPRGGKVVDRCQFTVGGTSVPNPMEMSMKSLV